MALAEAAQEWRLAIRAEGEEGSTSGPSVTSFALRLSPKCRVERVFLPAASTEEQRQTMSTFVAMVDVELKPSTTWTATHRDLTGEYAASYARDPDGSVVRRKRLYQARKGEAPTVRGSARYTVGGGWLRSVEVDETYAASGVTLPVSFRFAFDGMAEEVPPLPEGEWVPVDALWTSPSTPLPTEERPTAVDWSAFSSGDLERAREQALVAGKLARGDREALDRLRAVLRAAPREHRAPIYLALRVAGTGEAQLAILEAATDPSSDPSDHSNALAVMHDLEEPTDRTLESLERLYSEHAEEEVRGGAILALGSLAKKIPGAADALARAVAHFDPAAPTAPALIEAIGNSARGEYLERLLGWCQSSEENLREAAAQALRGYDDPRVVVRLTQLLRSDPSDFVAEAAASRGADYLLRHACRDGDALVEAAAARLGKRAAGRLESNLVRLLGACGENGTSQRALLDHLAVAASVETRREIGRYVSVEAAAKVLAERRGTR